MITEVVVFDQAFDKVALNDLFQAFEERYAFWALHLDGLLVDSFLVHAHNPGKMLKREAVAKLPEAISTSHYKAVSVWHDLELLFIEHDGFIRESARHAATEIEVSLTRLADTVLLARRRIRALENRNAHFARKFAHLAQRLKHNAPVYLWPSVHWTCYFLLPALGMLVLLLPLRNLPSIIHIAPLINQANRRSVYSVAALQLLREASYGDRLMGRDTLVLARDAFHLADEIIATDNVIRNGGALQIVDGTDHNFPEVDKIMYERADDLLIAPNETFYSFVAGGLRHTIFSSLDQTKRIAATILHPDPVPKTPPYYDHGRLRGFTGDIPWATVMWAIEPDQRDVVEVLTHKLQDYIDSESYKLKTVLHDSFVDLFAAKHTEMRLLFGLNLAFVIFGFLLAVFRSTVSMLLSEIERTRRFVRYMPLKEIDPELVERIRYTFADDEEG
eukprot:CAMPEP_0175886042 /NCGR_PEP_ID=MMETSP0107_2-20121207/45406_1 /TAXON_ID=195067 ORGANISM="Goniomonas pacifica, Strain CCMP1869" /NCGR_SAMPLE_ID=MMETSP0107_2 /ASSEMBLY_ACC=CAM_ASM_000203 /LENGTH=445 /DNA_ID=CAMNT_0017206359 /DNA_START=17 /DNA_END=1351 /DNA_ORIENTATION=-